MNELNREKLYRTLTSLLFCLFFPIGDTESSVRLKYLK